MTSLSLLSVQPDRSTIVRAKKRPALPRLGSAGLRLLSGVSPDLAAAIAYRLWFGTGARLRRRPEAEALWSAADPLLLHHRGAVLRGAAWGDGPRVLLVHGWGGDSAQLSELVRPLVNAGHRVMAYDLPAHGLNPGRHTNVFEAADAISAIGRDHGPLHAVVAHSFGTLASLVAIRQKLLTGRVVALAPTVLLHTMIAGFADRLGLSQPVRNRLAGRVLEFAGRDFWSDLSQPHPGLIIHDDTDGLAPIANAEYLASIWPDARLNRTSGLGHYRLLRDPGVIAQVVDFVAAALPSPPVLPVEDGVDVARVRRERPAGHPAVPGHHDVRSAG